MSASRRVRRGFHRIGVVGVLLILVPAALILALAGVELTEQPGRNLQYSEADWAALTAAQQSALVRAQQTAEVQDMLWSAVSFVIVAVIFYILARAVGWIVAGFVED